MATSSFGHVSVLIQGHINVADKGGGKENVYIHFYIFILDVPYDSSSPTRSVNEEKARRLALK